MLKYYFQYEKTYHGDQLLSILKYYYEIFVDVNIEYELVSSVSLR